MVKSFQNIIRPSLAVSSIVKLNQTGQSAFSISRFERTTLIAVVSGEDHLVMAVFYPMVNALLRNDANLTLYQALGLHILFCFQLSFI